MFVASILNITPDRCLHFLCLFHTLPGYSIAFGLSRGFPRDNPNAVEYTCTASMLKIHSYFIRRVSNMRALVYLFPAPRLISD